MYRYSKSSQFYFETKASFFEQNQSLLNKARRINTLYARQPGRNECKLCSGTLSGKRDFASHQIEYVFCEQCGHLNGMHEDTLDFCNEMYIDGGGNDYSVNYVDENYGKRMLDIYLPKFDFLVQSLPANPKYRYLDIGCGAGYFTAAGISRNVHIVGVDVGETLVNFGNSQISNLYDCSPLSHANESDFFDIVADGEYDVIAAIGVIEHLREPRKFFEAFKRGRARYLFFSVPMFSMSVVIEHALQSVFPRQLSSGHTHLFTEKSIGMMKELLVAKSIAEWRFGTDALDLLRSCLVRISQESGSEKFSRLVSDSVSPLVDKIQSVMDESHFCSEIHCVFEKK